MKNKSFNFSLVFFFCIFYSSLHAQNMYVKPTTGSQATYLITELQKITFSNGNLLVTPILGTAINNAFWSNRYVSFKDITLATTEYQLDKSISVFYVYPNPVKDILNLHIPEQGKLVGNIEIISLEGRLLLQRKKLNTSLPQIDVSMLPLGMYICKTTIGNITQAAKFFKQ